VWLTNRSAHRPLWCWNADDRSQALRIKPGPAQPLPFEISVLGVEPSETMAFAVVFGPEPRKDDRRSYPCLRSQALDIDRDSEHFRVLQILCSTFASTHIVLRPTQVADVTRREGRPMTARAVRHHLDRLADKFQVVVSDDASPSSRQLEQIIHYALAHGIV
jgi:hypothetical protein